MFAAIRQPGRLLRLAALLLALVQVIAPMWHVCEMGGSSCCKPAASGVMGEYSLHCARPSSSIEPAKDRKQNSAPQCNACPRENAASQNKQKLDATLSPFSGTCLAKLLQAMHSDLIALPSPIEYPTVRFVATEREYSFRAKLFFKLPPSRGPPRLS